MLVQLSAEGQQALLPIKRRLQLEHNLCNE